MNATKTCHLRASLHLGLAAAFLISEVGAEEPTPDPAKDKASFEQAAAAGEWREVFSDSGPDDWKGKWFLDGEVGTLKNTSEGMVLIAGPEFANNEHHMVFWTKDRFEGDLKIEFDYTRLDEAPNCVTILHVQATGGGREPYAKDITEWNELREVPAINMYFNPMHTCPNRYAAFQGMDNPKSYVRGRRYVPGQAGLDHTDLKPDYFAEGLFKTGVPPQDHGREESARALRAHRKRGADTPLPHAESRSPGDYRRPYRPAPHVYPLRLVRQFSFQRAGVMMT